MTHKKFKQYLDDINATQADFAREMGVTPVCIHGWLTGKRKPGHEMIKKLGRVTGGYLTWDDFHGDNAMYV